MQYKSENFRAVSVVAVKEPAEFLLASHHHICQLQAEQIGNVLKISCILAVTTGEYRDSSQSVAYDK